MTPLGALIGARVRRIDAPKPGLLCVGLYGRELKATLVFCAGEKSAGVGLVASRPHGDAADSFVLKLRKELDNARVTALGAPTPGMLGLSLQRQEHTFELECDFGEARVTLRVGETTLASHSWPRTGAARGAAAWPETLEELAAAGPRLLEESAADALDAERSALSRAIRSTQKRLERRLGALAQDIERTREVEPLRARANLLLTQQQRVKRGDTSVRVIDYSLDPPQELEIALDPARTTKEQIEAWFKQAKRFERGAQFARERAQATEREIAQLEALRAQLTAADATALAELTKRARALGVRGISLGKVGPSDKARPAQQKHKPFRELRGSKERTILVGKGAADNDVLTREHARPQDLWLHARNVAGAHVVVPLERNETCPQELLLDAAHLAAHFSDARSERVVDVSYTPKRFVRKPRGAPAGQVLLDREKVLTLHLDPQRLAALLKTELV